MAIPKIYETEFIKPVELVEGKIYEVVNEFAPNPKFPKSFLIGKIEGDTTPEVRYLGLNKTSYFEIAKFYGEDTKRWIGKYIKYLGIKACGKMEGKVFVAVEKEV